MNQSAYFSTFTGREMTIVLEKKNEQKIFD